MKKEFTTALLFSLVIHLIFFKLGDIYLPVHKIVSAPEKSKELRIKAILVIESARVDVVQMPTHTVQELKQLETIQVTQESTERKHKLFIKMLRDIADKEIERPRPQPLEQQNLKVLLMAQNKLSKGLSLTGETRSSEMNAFYQYLETLPAHIKQGWKLPIYLLNRNLRCRIQIKISDDGRLLEHEIIESSGVEEYDRLALNATIKSAPLPRPVPAVIPLLKEGYIILGFPD